MIQPLIACVLWILIFAAYLSPAATGFLVMCAVAAIGIRNHARNHHAPDSPGTLCMLLDEPAESDIPFRDEEAADTV